MRQRIIIALSLVAAIGRVPARANAQAVIETPTLRVELIGLRRWSLKMVEDSLAKYAPADGLTSHACAAILRGKLHFADAAVSNYIGFTRDQKNYVAITIVEPQDSALIRYKPAFRDTLPARAEWKAAYAALRAKNELAQRALQTPGFYAEQLAGEYVVTFAAIAPLHALIAEHRASADRAQAIHTLAADGNDTNRVVAALLLGNFAAEDETWWALADAVRDPIGIVSGTASTALNLLATTSPRQVDWRPKARELRYVVDGTNLFGFSALVTALARTHVSPDLAPALLGGNGAIVLAKLRSGEPMAHDRIAEFLAQLSGKPVTTSADEWERWVKGLVGIN